MKGAFKLALNARKEHKRNGIKPDKLKAYIVDAKKYLTDEKSGKHKKKK